jgi:hypothetical protein
MCRTAEIALLLLRRGIPHAKRRMRALQVCKFSARAPRPHLCRADFKWPEDLTRPVTGQT